MIASAFELHPCNRRYMEGVREHSPKKSVSLLVSLLAAISFSSGCSRDNRDSPVPTSTERATSNDQPLRVVATYSILGDWVQKIGGEQVALTVLVGPEGDAHTYEPTPRDSVALAEAEILFENGLGFEVWLDRLFQASDSAAQRVVVTQSIKPCELVVSDSRTEIDPTSKQSSRHCAERQTQSMCRHLHCQSQHVPASGRSNPSVSLLHPLRQTCVMPIGAAAFGAGEESKVLS